MDKHPHWPNEQAMREAAWMRLVLRLPENIVMSCGVWPMNGFSYAVLTAGEGPAALIGLLRGRGDGRLLGRRRPFVRLAATGDGGPAEARSAACWPTSLPPQIDPRPHRL